MQILLPRPERNGWLNGAVRSHFVSRKPSQAEKYLHVSCLSAKMRDAQYSSKWQHSSHPDLQGAARIIRILPAICRTIPSSPDLHLIVKRAAEIQGLTMTDFVIHALQIAASQTIERADRVRLSVLDQEAFANALIAPAKPNAALKRAFAKANKLLTA